MLKRLSILIFIALALALPTSGEPADVLTLRIRPSVHLRAATATVADVVVCSGATELVEQVGRAPLLAELTPPATATVSHRQIEERLIELGLSPATLLLTGATACQVTLEPAEPPALAAAAPRNGTKSAKSPGGQTLADAVRTALAVELADLGGTPEIDFDQASAPFLDLTAPPWEFALQPRGGQQLGVREFRVGLRRAGRTHRNVTLMGRVRLNKPVLVALQPLNVGTTVAAGAVGLETRLFDSEQEIGLDAAEPALGQRVAQFVAAGQMVRPANLQKTDLVQRSRPVTILGAGSNVQVRVAGVALDSGGYGETVRVRVGDSRRSRTVLSGVVTGVGTVRVEEAVR